MKKPTNKKPKEKEPEKGKARDYIVTPSGKIVKRDR